MPASPVPRTISFDPKMNIWEPRGGCPRAAPYRVFRSTLQGLNQSIVGLSPLSETT
jgi:hypothetical protein